MSAQSSAKYNLWSMSEVSNPTDCSSVEEQTAPKNPVWRWNLWHRSFQRALHKKHSIFFLTVRIASFLSLRRIPSEICTGFLSHGLVHKEYAEQQNKPSPHTNTQFLESLCLSFSSSVSSSMRGWQRRPTQEAHWEALWDIMSCRRRMHECSDTAGGGTMPQLSACGGEWTRKGCKEWLWARKDLVFRCVLSSLWLNLKPFDSYLKCGLGQYWNESPNVIYSGIVTFICSDYDFSSKANLFACQRHTAHERMHSGGSAW